MRRTSSCLRNLCGNSSVSTHSWHVVFRVQDTFFPTCSVTSRIHLDRRIACKIVRFGPLLGQRSKEISIWHVGTTIPHAESGQDRSRPRPSRLRRSCRGRCGPALLLVQDCLYLVKWPNSLLGALAGDWPSIVVTLRSVHSEDHERVNSHVSANGVRFRSIFQNTVSRHFCINYSSGHNPREPFNTIIIMQYAKTRVHCPRQLRVHCVFGAQMEAEEAIWVPVQVTPIFPSTTVLAFYKMEFPFLSLFQVVVQDGRQVTKSCNLS